MAVRGEDDVASDGVRECADRIGRSGGERVVVDADLAQVEPESRLEEGSR
jgi:hypothetical protein